MLPQVTSPPEDVRLQTREITPELIAYVAEKIAQAIRPECIVLFGSWARGAARPASDVDLLVVHYSRADADAARQAARRIRDRVRILLATPSSEDKM